MGLHKFGYSYNDMSRAVQHNVFPLQIGTTSDLEDRAQQYTVAKFGEINVLDLDCTIIQLGGQANVTCYIHWKVTFLTEANATGLEYDGKFILLTIVMCLMGLNYQQANKLGEFEWTNSVDATIISTRKKRVETKL